MGLLNLSCVVGFWLMLFAVVSRRALSKVRLYLAAGLFWSCGGVGFIVLLLSGGTDVVVADLYAIIPLVIATVCLSKSRKIKDEGMC